MAAAIGYPLHHIGTTALHPRHHHAVRHLLIVGCAMTVMLVAVVNPAPTKPLATASVSAVSSLAQPSTAPAENPVNAPIAKLEAGIAKAKDALTASHGRVLDESTRTRLDALIRSSDEAVRFGRMLAAISAPGTMPDFSASLGATQTELVGEIESAIATVEAAVVAWEAVQARIAAEKEAARLAAEAAARAPARSRTAVAAVGAGPHTEGIWTSGGQAEIDACRGSVNLSDIAGYLGGSFYAAEHWSCGGRVWAGIGTGELVSFPGFGLYQVAGRVGGLPAGSFASSLPSGYDGYYQTCMNGNTNNLYVWLLTRVG